MATQPLIVAASLLAADFARLGEEAESARRAGADWLHLDVMDNHYVPNLTFGADVCRALRRTTALPIDAHLMTDKPESLVAPFAAAGAQSLTFHPDATRHAHRAVGAIKDAGMSAGVAFNPGAPLSPLPHLLESVDMVLLMTVNPGFGGQRFISAMLGKIGEARRLIDNCGRDIRLQVDGGIDAETAPQCRRAGADTLVAGSAVFAAVDYAAAIASLRGE